MSWRDRDYHEERPGGAMPSAASLLSFSLRFGRWLGVPVRLHFWLLLTLIFLFAGFLEGAGLMPVLTAAALLLAALLAHEFAHRTAAHRLGGRHEEFLLWPAGGMIPPELPQAPTPSLIGHAAGPAMNLLLAVACWLGYFALTRQWLVPLLSPFAIFGTGPAGDWSLAALGPSLLRTFFGINVALVLVNLLPYYWFDGGYIWQAVLWRWTGLRKAILAVCIAGMALAVPMALLALLRGNLFGLILWGLLLASAFMRFREQKYAPADEEADWAYSASLAPDRPARARRRSWLSRRRQVSAQREQQEVDAILAKVSRQGMQSLNWRERRTLKQATRRQRGS